ncbi:MAG: TetR/AcrR family transcriptional regulator [Oscillospiraceae bacterium]|nr:TetR/AcrR family transcriptional regulator [Oscillospiraceae bacterium]
MTTKERITEEALTLFAEKGYKGTSVKNIADAVGMKDASLYHHFKSKQEIFDSIVELLFAHMDNLAKALKMPPYNQPYPSAAEFYAQLDLAGLQSLSRKVFLFYLTNPYFAKFWRIAHMEQYSNPQIYQIYEKIFMEDSIAYQEKLFQSMIDQGIFYPADAKAMAINFYAPIFFLLSKYNDRPEQKAEALELLDRQIAEFYRVYRKKDETL